MMWISRVENGYKWNVFVYLKGWYIVCWWCVGVDRYLYMIGYLEFIVSSLLYMLLLGIYKFFF